MNAARRKLLASRVLAFFFLLGQTTPGLAVNAEPGQQREQDEANIQKLKSGMEIHLGKLQIAGQQEFDLLGEIEKFDQELSLQQVRLEVMRERRDSQKELLAVKLRELQAAKASSAGVRQHLQVRLHAFYLTGKTGILNVAFSTRNLPDLMFFNDSFKRLLEYDHALIVKYRQAIEQLTQATEAHERESALLDDFIAKAKAEQEKLDAILGQKRELLKKVKTEKTLHEQALREMRKAEADLQASLASMRQEKTALPPPDQGFVLNKGKMAPPVSGALLTRFGAKQDDKVVTGIVIDAANGAEITAIAAGRIVFAGYRRGYGNMVILDHGGDYYSITARMDKLKSLPGNRVKAGDVIGVAGDIATLFDKGIYFEIRHDSEPEDPLSWITMQGLTETGPSP